MKYIIRFSTLSIFWSDWIRSVKMNQNGSKWIKTDQTWSYQISDEIINEIYCQIFNFISCLIRFNQICPKWVKLDQNVSSDFQILFFWSKWIRSLQNGSNLIKLDFRWNNHWNIWSDFQLYLFFDQIESDLSKMDQNGSNLIKLDFWWNNHWNISLDF